MSGGWGFGLSLAVVVAVLSAATAQRADGGGPPSGAATDSTRRLAVGQGKAALFARANEAYEAGEYELAIEGYRDLIARGYGSAPVYYNLGNAYFKGGKLGKAIASLRRAELMAPRDEDIAYNLEYLRSLTRDKQLISERNPLLAALVRAHRGLSLNESLWLGFCLYVAAVLLALVLVFWESPVVRRGIRILYLLHPLRLGGLSHKTVHRVHLALVLLLLVLAFGSTAGKIHDRGHRTRAVVIEGEVDVMSGPGRDYTVEFLLHEGTEVTIGEERGTWTRVELPGGLSGWADRGALEVIEVRGRANASISSI